MRIPLAALALVISSNAYATEQCSDVLLYAARNNFSKIDQSDQRKYFYKSVCENSNTSLGVDYKSAQVIFGLNYGSREDYCNNEKKFSNSSSYTSQNSSIVVQSALDAYAKCMRLNDKGIKISISMSSPENPTSFSFGIERTNANPQTLSGLTISDPDAIKCVFIKPGSKEQEILDKTFNIINFPIPENDSVYTISCVRANNTKEPSGREYPEVQATVHTTGGDFPIALPDIAKISPRWASEIYSSIESVNKKVDKIDNRLSKTHLEFVPRAVVDISTSQGDKDCPGPNQIVYGFIGAPGNNTALDMWKCADLKLVIP